MSDPVTIALITACGSLPAAAMGIVSAWFAYRAAINSKEAVEVSKQTEKNTNHLTEELVALTKKSSHAEGLLEGRSENGG